jgi:hypothetical protein
MPTAATRRVARWQAKQRAAGKCIVCTKDAARKRNGELAVYCEGHLKGRARMNAAATKELRARWWAAGCCGQCGTPTTINPRTGQHYRACFPHRLTQSKCQQTYYHARTLQQT